MAKKKKTKKYSINWEEDVPVSFEVDGVQYQSLEEISNEKDRLRLEAMLNSAEDAEFDAEFEKHWNEAQQEQGTPIEKIILPIFTGVAILVVLIAAISSGRRPEGQVVPAAVRHPDQDGPADAQHRRRGAHRRAV